jgi:hypothetical protein
LLRERSAREAFSDGLRSGHQPIDRFEIASDDFGLVALVRDAR